MLSSATRKLRFWKKQPDKKKEVTTEDEALLDEIEQQRKIIGGLREECARLKELKFGLEQYKAKHEGFERRTVQQTRIAERQQNKLQTSLKLAKEEIERLAAELRTTRNATCGKCDLKPEDKKKYTGEINDLQETIARLERENKILQSLVREYTSQASQTSRKIRLNPFSNESSQISVRSDSTQPTILERDLRRSSLSLNDFLDDSVDDIQSEKFEADKSSACSSLDEDQKDVFNGVDFFQEVSAKTTTAGRERDGANFSVNTIFKPLTIENLIAESKEMEQSESPCSVSEVSSCVNISSLNSSSQHDLSSVVTASTRTLEKSYSSETIHVGPESTTASSSLKNLSSFSEQGNVVLGSNKKSKSNPDLYMGIFSDVESSIGISPVKRVRTKKRRSLDDPKTLSKIYLENKSHQTDLQRAIKFFRSAGNNDDNIAGNSRNVVMTKDRVAALREYFEGKTTKAPMKVSLVTTVSDVQQIKMSVVQKTEEVPIDDKVEPRVENKRKLYSIPRLNGFHRIVKGKAGVSGTPQSNSSPNTHKQPTRSSIACCSVRSASVPSPSLTRKCRESIKFKIAFTKSTSLKSFNHFTIGGHPRSDCKTGESKVPEPSRLKKCYPTPKNPLKIPLKSSVIADLEKYKLTSHSVLPVVHENVYNSEAIPPVLVDVSEEASDSCLSTDEKKSVESSSQTVVPKSNGHKVAILQQEPVNTYKSSHLKRVARLPPQNNQVVACQCRSKAQAIKNESACKLSKPKVTTLRTNGSVAQKITFSANKRSLEDKSLDVVNRVIQKDDPETNQTFFYEVGSPTKNPVTSPTTSTKSSPKMKKIHLRSIPLGNCSTSAPGSFSPEKFILTPNLTPQIDPSAQHRQPIPKRANDPRSQHPALSFVSPNKPYQPGQQKNSIYRKAPNTQRDKPPEFRRPVQQGTDKHWSQCAKYNQSNPDCTYFAVNTVIGNGSKKVFEKSSKMRTASSTSRQPQTQIPINNGCQEDGTFDEISKQLDKLTLTVNSLQAKRTQSSFM